MRFLTFLRSRMGAAAVAALIAGSVPALAAFVVPSLSQHDGRQLVTGAPPTGTGCTIAAGSTSMAGKCTATASSGSIAFAQAFASAPFCVVQDSFGTPAIVYTTTTAQITLTTVTSTHVYYWNCMGPA